ncbi:hypothetical protein M3Y98_00920700 [Aphelenchoides besseyi]|nr:hypothetical protein M3Y98_00920700 [Aphelenchoides besseyi]KAI6193438.1 hypothetical protein M3Y96_01017700 [Aphelenchoides besseyi]
MAVVSFDSSDLDEYNTWEDDHNTWKDLDSRTACSIDSGNFDSPSSSLILSDCSLSTAFDFVAEGDYSSYGDDLSFEYNLKAHSTVGCTNLLENVDDAKEAADWPSFYQDVEMNKGPGRSANPWLRIAISVDFSPHLVDQPSVYALPEMRDFSALHANPLFLKASIAKLSDVQADQPIVSSAQSQYVGS